LWTRALSSRLPSRSRSRASWIVLPPALLTAMVTAAWGQSGTPAAVSGGQGEIAFQGSYAGGSGQPLLDITGAAAHFQELVPGLGLLSGGFEGYSSQNQFAAGENFLELRGAPWMGQYWSLTGGDFHAPANLVEFPFNNIFNPEIEGRGFQMKATHDDNEYTFFVGEQTLSAGLRVTYRLVTPQMVTGFSAVRKLLPNLRIGARMMQFSASPQAMLDNPFLFPAGRDAPLVRTAAFESLYTPVKRLKIYAEGSQPLAGARPAVTSLFGGAAWEDDAWLFKANYTHEGIEYFPLAGYFAGDREGPFAEARWRPRKGMEFYGSVSQYRNNLERDNSLPTLQSFSTSAGASSRLPGDFSASATLSTIQFTQHGGGQDAATSQNRQFDSTLTRPLRRHTLHTDWREIWLDNTGMAQRQRSWETGDNFQTKHLALGGAVRYQQIAGGGERNSVFFRGLAQASLGRFSVYANMEAGNDLQNQTLFSTSAYHTSVVGVAWRVARGWNLQAEAFQNLLNVTLNPQNIFLLENGPALEGLSPAAASLASTRQWRFYFRLSKQLRWGAGLPGENRGGLAVRAATLTGTIEGVVKLKALAGNLGAPGIPLTLDGDRTAVTGADGRYIFENVPEGAHEVGLALGELPADFDPGERQTERLLVQPRHATRAEFDVLPLLAIGGSVTGPEGAPREGIVIRLLPGGRYTTTDTDGNFAFHNVREGDFTLALDPQTLPEGGDLISPASIPVSIRAGSSPPAPEFRFAVKSRGKPIRKVLEVSQAGR
jgi:hypothetical protein